MDHFNIPIGLIIGMCFVFSLLTNGQTTAQSTTTTASTTTASTGCKTAETNSPPEEGCTIVCGNQIYQAYTQICGSRRKRLASGLQLKDIGLDKEEASKFLIGSRRSKFVRGKRSGSGETDIVEECCDEHCVVEEIDEYC